MKAFTTFLTGLVLVFTANATATVSAEEPSERYSKGVGLYQQEDFRGALDIWMDLYSTGYENFELLYNTGNAWFKTGEVAMAILFYERAALRKPGNDDLKYNLSIARAQIRDRYDEIPEVFFVRWFNYLALALGTDTWAVIALIAFVAGLGFMLLFLFTARYGLKIVSFWVSGMILLVFLSSVSLSLRNRKLVYDSRKGVIVAPVLTGRSSPSESSNQLFVIHEGLKVGIGERIGDWCEIRLPDGNKGWVPGSSLEVI